MRVRAIEIDRQPRLVVAYGQLALTLRDRCPGQPKVRLSPARMAGRHAFEVRRSLFQPPGSNQCLPEAQLSRRKGTLGQAPISRDGGVEVPTSHLDSRQPELWDHPARPRPRGAGVVLLGLIDAAGSQQREAQPIVGLRVTRVVRHHCAIVGDRGLGPPGPQENLAENQLQVASPGLFRAQHLEPRDQGLEAARAHHGGRVVVQQTGVPRVAGQQALIALDRGLEITTRRRHIREPLIRCEPLRAQAMGRRIVSLRLVEGTPRQGLIAQRIVGKEISLCDLERVLEERALVTPVSNLEPRRRRAREQRGQGRDRESRLRRGSVAREGANSVARPPRDHQR